MTLPKIREWHNVDAAIFRNEIVPAEQPAVLKGLVKNWPAVQAGLKSPQVMCEYLTRFDAGSVLQTLVGPPAIKGRYFYTDDLRGLNFERKKETFRAAIERLLTHLHEPDPPAIAIQAASVLDYLPGFSGENAHPLLSASVIPRIWIGNAVTIAAHYDTWENIACVAAGRRRFTLFPPDEVSNLYVGPLELTPAGAPISLVSLDAPELDRFPRFREALASATTANLDPGDAIYIPYLWWHHVESLERFNVLVNYWWSLAPATLSNPLFSIFHGMLAISALPPDQRKAWRALFDHYVFRINGEPGAHLPSGQQGIIAPMTPELAGRIKALLIDALNRP